MIVRFEWGLLRVIKLPEDPDYWLGLVWTVKVSITFGTGEPAWIFNYTSLNVALSAVL